MMNSPTRDKPRCNVATRSSVRSSAIVGESRLPISSSRMCFTEITRRLIYSFYFDALVLERSLLLLLIKMISGYQFVSLRKIHCSCSVYDVEVKKILESDL